MFKQIGIVFTLAISSTLLAQSPVSIGVFTPSTSRDLLDLNHTFTSSQAQSFAFLTYVQGDQTLVGDWNGDGRSKLGVYRGGSFYLDFNGNGIWEPGVDKLYTFIGSSAGDVPVLGDWNHDGRTKIGVYRQGFWILDLNGNGIWDGTPTDSFIGFGGAYPAYIPVVGDWNGDGRTKVGTYHAGSWSLDYNGNGVSDAGDQFTTFGGTAGDQPVVGDWTGNGKTKIGIYRTGFWLLDLNGNGSWDGASGDQFTAFGGNAGEVPVVGDWNGDGRSKVGVFFGAGNWWLDANGNGKWDGYNVDFASTFGTTGDTPVIGKWSVGGPSLPNSLNINNSGLSTGHAGAGAQTFTFNYRDISGAANIVSGQVEFIDSTPGGIARCNFQWQRPNILNVYTTGASTNTLGTTISDGFCTVSLTSITNSPTDPSVVAVTVSVAFQQDYPGVYGTQTYGVQTQVTDTNGFQTSWGQVGTWTVDQSPIGPYSGSGASQTFTVSAADPNGQAYTSITNVQVIFNWSASTADACFLSYDTVSDKLYLADKTGNLSIFPPLSLKSPGGTLGSIAQNTSNCQIDGSSSSISGSGSSLYLNLKTTFNTTFIGQQNTYVLVSDNLGNGQAVLQGSWTAFPAPSANPPTSILPSGLNTDGTHTMTFTFDDPNGFSYVPGMYVQIGQTFEDPGNCRFLYWRGTGAQNHTVNVYSDSWGSYLGQAPVGQPGAIISSTNRCAVNIGASFFGENGTRGALNAVIDIKNALPNGQITVWTLPFDRQIAHTPLWAASTFSIAAADFKLEPIPTISIQQTQTPFATGFQIPISVFGNFTGTVAFTCAAPTGASVACSGPINVGTNGNTANFSVTPTSGTVSGNISITGTSGSLTHTLQVPLNISAVPPPPSLTFSGNQAIQVSAGGTATFALVVTGVNGWTNPVTIHTYPADANIDFCTVINGACSVDYIAGNDITVTPPATVYFKAHDHVYAAGQSAVFSPSISAPVSIDPHVYFNFSTVGTATPSYTLTAPTQITIPAGGTVTSTISIVQQGAYTGTQNLTSSTGIATFGQNQLTLGPNISIASTYASFGSGILAPGTYYEDIFTDSLHHNRIQVVVTPSTTKPLALISFGGSAASLPNNGTAKPYSLPFSYGYADKIYSACQVTPTRPGFTITRGLPTVRGCAPDNSVTCQVPFTAAADSSVPAGTYSVSCKYDDSLLYPNALGTPCAQTPYPLCIAAGSLSVYSATPPPLDNTPFISSLNPSTVASGQTTILTISGSNFGKNPTIYIGGVGYPTSGVSNSITIVYIDPGSPQGALIPVYLVSNGASGVGFLPAPQASATSNTKYILVSLTTLSVAVKSRSHDNPTNNSFVTIGPSDVVYGGSEDSTSDSLQLSASVDFSIGGVNYAWSVSGPGAANYPPPVMSQSSWNVGRILPLSGVLTFQVDAAFPNGTHLVSQRTVEVGIRTDDVIILGYIDGSRIPTPDGIAGIGNVNPRILSDLPSEINSLSAAAACLNRFISLSGNDDSIGTTPLTDSTPLSDADREYILYWQFVRAANPDQTTVIQGDFRDLVSQFTSESKVSSYTADPTNFKLFNRFQVKYRVLNGNFNGPPIVLSVNSVPKVGQTPNPCHSFNLPAFNVSGQEGFANSTSANGPLVATAAISQINDGSPDMIGVAELNTLLGKSVNSKRYWENIGSRITFSVDAGTKPAIYRQPFPTYLLFQNGAYRNLFAQADFPQTNFNTNPFPSGTASCQRDIVDGFSGLIIQSFITPGGRCGDMHSTPEVSARPSPYIF